MPPGSKQLKACCDFDEAATRQLVSDVTGAEVYVCFRVQSGRLTL